MSSIVCIVLYTTANFHVNFIEMATSHIEDSTLCRHSAVCIPVSKKIYFPCIYLINTKHRKEVLRKYLVDMITWYSHQ